MSSTPPTIEFFAGVPEALSNVSLRRSKTKGIRNVLFTFTKLQSLEKLKSFTKQSHGNLRLNDSEGIISAEISSLRFIFGGDEGDDLLRVECGFEVKEDDHWERFMRFMNRYAEANGMGYEETSKDQNTASENS